ncbi:hypothetical protein HMPREF1624_00111 [Sporothrix schenckii ATCC 58251]|uniref:R3H domain-containing protein n=1 Tax=Sporothrix schenckii (strain ATCC 58251 / de Perez 2211183) TaxID=1391915 RepID=U7Q3P3_SPOS1|nr:hypothetical protein HMPREF1624_00111 [Sporothrix schenckii ATCC 58251]
MSQQDSSKSRHDSAPNAANGKPSPSTGSVKPPKKPVAIPEKPAASTPAVPKKTEAATAGKSVADGLVELQIAPTNPGLVLDDATLDAAADGQAGTAGTSSTAASAAVSAAASATASANQTTPSSSDDVSQKADSSSDLDTKPPSLDGKSITSGTTFNALDEKESLRPDDSASVKAAADEDDSFSVRRSLLVSSRMGSDVAARVQRIQLGDMPPRLVPLTSQEPAVSGVATPHSISSEQQPVTEARVQLATSTSTPGGLNGQNPDEKLLDAMASQKNRVFLLRLESEVVDFVQNSKEPFMDLPPSNSFCRMLTHKLADYYHMTHSFEAVAGSVRIYRTPFCRVPPPLASFVPVNTPESTNAPPQIVKPRKIMRRGEEFDQPASTGPSKPTSEDGSDLKEKAPPAKEKMTREEREEAYNRARERIFAMPTESSTPENDDGTGISRASSVSAKDKAAQGKKAKTAKQRRDDSESFDSRSQYTPFYHHSQQATWVNPQFMPTGNLASFPYNAQQQHQQQHQPNQPTQTNQPNQQPHGPQYPNNMQPPIAYGTPQTAYPPVVSSNGPVPPANGMAHYPPQPGPPHHPGSQNGPHPYLYGPSGQPGNAAPPQHWQQHQQPQMQPQPYNNGAAYPSPQARSVAPNSALPAGMTYAYGQLPAHYNPNDPKAQHPIPGSYAGTYTRHGFNPKTQSFVPGTGPMAMPMAMPIPMAGPHGAYGATNGPGPVPMGMSPGQNQGSMPYNNGGYQQPSLSTSPYGSSTTSSYGMMRQGSGSSTSAYPMGQQPYPGPVAYHDPYGNTLAHGPPLPGAPGPGHLPPPHGPPHAVPLGAPLGAPRGPSHYKMNAPHSAAQGPKKSNGAPAPKGPGQSNGTSQSQKGSGQAYGNLPNYGNPATLPQKPTSA